MALPVLKTSAMGAFNGINVDGSTADGAYFRVNGLVCHNLSYNVKLE
jgi:hypothetical protein